MNNLIRIISLFLIFIYCIANNSCKKEDKFKEVQNVNIEKFMNLPSNCNPLLERITAELERQQKINPSLIPNIVERNGFPIWSKSQYSINSEFANFITANEDTIIYIPLAVQGDEKVSAFFLATINEYIRLELYNKYDYEQLGFDTVGRSTAHKLALQFMILDFEAFGHKTFKLNDDRLLKDFEIALGTPIKDRIIQIDHAQNPSYEGRGWTTWDYLICKTTQVLNCSANTNCCTVAGVSPGSCTACEKCWTGKVVCEKVSVLVYYDDGYEPPTGGGSGGGGGGGGSVPYNGPIQTCNPTPLLENGLPPCPKGTTLGWEPVELSDIFEFSHDPNGIEYVDISANEPQIDLKSLFNCFANVPDFGATYMIKLCVDLPINSMPMGSLNIKGSPGHTFLTLTKSDGIQTISQSVGFYPIGEGGNPFNPTANGGFKNNGFPPHEYNAALEATVNATQFSNVIENLLAHENDTYNLFNNNCTTRALEAYNLILTTPLQIEPLHVNVPISAGSPPIDFYFLQSPQKLYKKIINTYPGTGVTKEIEVEKDSPLSTNLCP